MDKKDLRIKFENFWYYYKWYVVGGVLLVLCLLVGIRSCNRRINPDLQVLFAADKSANSQLVAEMETWLSGMTEDVNGDGETIARVLTTVTLDQWSGNNTAALVVQATTGDAILYILTDETYAVLHENGLLQPLTGESPYLDGDRYLLRESGALKSVPAFEGEEIKDYYLCIRKVEGSNLEGSARHIQQEKLAKSVLKQLIEKE